MTAFAPAPGRRGFHGHSHSRNGSTHYGHMSGGVTLMLLLMVLITVVLVFVVFRRMLRAERQRRDHPSPTSPWIGTPPAPPTAPPMQTSPVQDQRAPHWDGLSAGSPNQHRFDKF